MGLRWCFLLRSHGCHIVPKKDQQNQRSFDDDLARSSDDLAKIWRLKLTPTSIDLTVVHQRLIRLNPRLSAVGDKLFNLPPNVNGLVLGQAHTRLGPTRRHPYLQNPLIFKFLVWAFLYNEGFEILLFGYLNLDLDLKSIK